MFRSSYKSLMITEDIDELRKLVIERLYTALHEWTRFEQKWDLNSRVLQSEHLKNLLLKDFKTQRENMRSALLQINSSKLDCDNIRNRIVTSQVIDDVTSRIGEFKSGLTQLILDIEKNPSDALAFNRATDIKDVIAGDIRILEKVFGKALANKAKDRDALFEMSLSELQKHFPIYNIFPFALPPIGASDFVRAKVLNLRVNQPQVRVKVKSHQLITPDGLHLQLNEKQIKAILAADKLAGIRDDHWFTNSQLGFPNLQALFTAGTVSKKSCAVIAYNLLFKKGESGAKGVRYQITHSLRIETE